MAKVRMVALISGFRDGVEWPARGELLDVPELEADDLVRIGLAERVTAGDVPAVERAVAPAAEVETATVPRRRRKGQE